MMDQDAPVSYCNLSGADVCVIMYQEVSVRSCVYVRQDVFTISVGNLPPGATVLIKVSFITELVVRSGSIIFSLSGSVAPWQQSAALNQTTQVRRSFVILFGLLIVTNLQCFDWQLCCISGHCWKDCCDGASVRGVRISNTGEFTAPAVE